MCFMQAGGIYLWFSAIFTITFLHTDSDSWPRYLWFQTWLPGYSSENIRGQCCLAEEKTPRIVAGLGVSHTGHSSQTSIRTHGQVRRLKEIHTDLPKVPKSLLVCSMIKYKMEHQEDWLDKYICGEVSSLVSVNIAFNSQINKTHPILFLNKARAWHRRLQLVVFGSCWNENHIYESSESVCCIRLIQKIHWADN